MHTKGEYSELRGGMRISYLIKNKSELLV